jgi:hypothetical protein
LTNRAKADAAKQEKAMSSDKKTPAPNQQSKMSPPDSLTKTTKEGDIELREEELKRATGGAVFAPQIIKQ